MESSMRSLSAQLDSPGLFAEMCSVSQGAFEPLVNRLEAKSVVFPCEADPLNVISCKNPNRDSFVKEVNGLDFGTVHITQTQFSLPRLIPIMDRGMFDIKGTGINSNVIGISLEDIFSSPPRREGKKLVLPDLSLRGDVLYRPIFKGKDVILFCSGRDLLIETVWQKLNLLEFLPIVSSMGFLAATGINFSVFFGDCPFAHALNLKKSLESARLLHESGISVIPHIYFAHEFHLKRWLVWLKENPTVSTIAVNSQFHSDLDASIIAEGLTYILDRVGRRVTVILEGPDSSKMSTLFRAFPRSVVVALKAISVKAQFGEQYEFHDGRIDIIKTNGATAAEIFNASEENYRYYLDSLFPESDVERKRGQDMRPRRSREIVENENPRVVTAKRSPGLVRTQTNETSGN